MPIWKNLSKRCKQRFDNRKIVNKLKKRRKEIEDLIKENNEKFSNMEKYISQSKEFTRKKLQLDLEDKLVEICKYFSNNNVNDISFKENQSFDKLSVEESDASILGKGVGIGAIAGLGTVGTVTAVGTAGTGASISSLSGVYAAKAVLAKIGFGTIASGGLGVAGGAAILGGITVLPAVGFTLYMYDKKLSKIAENSDTEFLKLNELEIEIRKSCRENERLFSNLNDINYVTIKFIPIMDMLLSLLPVITIMEEEDKDKFINIYYAKFQQGANLLNDLLSYTGKEDSSILTNAVKIFYQDIIVLNKLVHEANKKMIYQNLDFTGEDFKVLNEVETTDFILKAINGNINDEKVDIKQIDIISGTTSSVMINNYVEPLSKLLSTGTKINIKYGCAVGGKTVPQEEKEEKIRAQQDLIKTFKDRIKYNLARINAENKFINLTIEADNTHIKLIAFDDIVLVGSHNILSKLCFQEDHGTDKENMFMFTGEIAKKIKEKVLK